MKAWMLLVFALMAGCKSPPAKGRVLIEAQHSTLLTSSSCKVSIELND